MRRLSDAAHGWNGATIVHSALVGVVFLLTTLVLGVPAASALPIIASGSKCSSTWVNNADAMACFIQGQEDIRNGIRNPHYVACTADEEIYCCRDTASGQTCEGLGITTPPRERGDLDLRVEAILQAQRHPRQAGADWRRARRSEGHDL